MHSLESPSQFKSTSRIHAEFVLIFAKGSCQALSNGDFKVDDDEAPLTAGGAVVVLDEDIFLFLVMESDFYFLYFNYFLRNGQVFSYFSLHFPHHFRDIYRFSRAKYYILLHELPHHESVI